MALENGSQPKLSICEPEARQKTWTCQAIHLERRIGDVGLISGGILGKLYGLCTKSAYVTVNLSHLTLMAEHDISL